MREPYLVPMVPENKSSLLEHEPSKRSEPLETSSNKSSIRCMFRKLGMIGRRCKRSSTSRSSHGSCKKLEIDKKMTKGTIATEPNKSIRSNNSIEASAPFQEEDCQSQSTATVIKPSPSVLQWLQDTCPENVVAKILAAAGPQNMARLSCVSRHWYAVCLRESTLRYLCEELHKQVEEEKEEEEDEEEVPSPPPRPETILDENVFGRDAPTIFSGTSKDVTKMARDGREQPPFAAAVEEYEAPHKRTAGTAAAVDTTEDVWPGQQRQQRQWQQDQLHPEVVSAAPQPGSESGMRFEKLYKLKNVLGMGAYSTVREGFHYKSKKNNARLKLDKSVSYAVKCVDRERVSEEDERALLDEVSILRNLEHPNVIRLLDVFDEPAKYYLVMERVHGGELFDRVCSKSYYDEVEARECCIGLLHGIRYCHDKRIVHRDLKPENVLLSTANDDVSVKIADFGFAKRCPRQCYLTTLCGTPGYVAPEVPMGWPYDERVDLWSIGVMLYILLCGYPPFIEKDQRQIFSKIIKGDYELHEEYWGTVSDEAKDLVKSLMNVDRETRLTADGALRESPWILGDCEQLERIRSVRLPSSPKRQHFYYNAPASGASLPHSEAVCPARGVGLAQRGNRNKQQAYQHRKCHDVRAAATVLSITAQIIRKMPADCQQGHQHHKQNAGPLVGTITSKIIKKTAAAVAA